MLTPGRALDTTRVDFYSPTDVRLGPGRRREIGAILRERGVHRAVLLCGGHFAESTFYAEVIGSMAERHAASYAPVASRPRLQQLNEIVELAKSTDADGFVAIGGGSVIDVAKCAAVLLAEGGEIEDHRMRFVPPAQFVFPELPNPKIPIIAVPTTSGSASETNCMGAVRMMLDDGTYEGVSIRDPKVTPAVAILDPELVASLPPMLTLGTGANAFAHCVESIYSTAHEPISRAIALAGCQLIRTNLPRCVADGEDLEARGAMQLATAMSGMALGNTMLGVEHAVCHPVGDVYGIDHGIAHAVLLPHGLRYNLSAAAVDIAEIGRTAGFVDAEGPDVEATAAATVDAIASWLDGMGAPTRLTDLVDVQEDQLPLLAEHAFRIRCVPFNPRRVEGPHELIDIYRAAM